MEVVQVLLAAGAEVDIKNKYFQTPIYCASLYGNGEIVTYLLEAGANVNMKDKDNWTPLHWACWNGHSDIVQILLPAGADKTIKDSVSVMMVHLFICVIVCAGWDVAD